MSVRDIAAIPQIANQNELVHQTKSKSYKRKDQGCFCHTAHSRRVVFNTRRIPPGAKTNDNPNPITKPAISATHVPSEPNSKPNTSCIPIRNPISENARACFSPRKDRFRHNSHVNPPINP